MTDALTALLSAIPALAKAGGDIAAASDEAKRNAQLIDFQRAIIQLQSAIASIQLENAGLVRDKQALEARIAHLENWETEKSRYALVTVLDGLPVRALRKNMSEGEAPHWLCPNCFNSGKKSFLTSVNGATGFAVFGCASCKTQMQAPYRGPIPPQFAEDST
jgi:hypothetical protein